MSKLIHCICSCCLLMIVLFVSSCSKDEESGGKAQILFIHGMSDVSNCTLLVSDSLYLSLSAGFGNFTQYNQVESGNQLIKVMENLIGTVLLEKNFKLSQNKNYTVMTAGVSGSADLFIKEDDLSVPDTTKAYIRLINLCPNSNNMSLSIVGGMDLASNVTYKSVSSFTAFSPGKYEMTVKSGNTIVASIPNISISANKKFSILLTGFVNQNPKASYNIIVNK